MSAADPGRPLDQAWGVTIPMDRPLAGHREVLERLAAAGYTDFWTAETAGNDAFTPLAVAAQVLPGAQVGSAVASVFTRGPAVLAMTAATLADLAPGRFTLGIGASSPAIVTDWNGVEFRAPLARVRDTLHFLRSALAGERVDAEYETFAVHGFRLERPPDPAPPLVVGALRPRMLRLAGELADGAVLNWLAAGDVPRCVDELRRGGEGPRVVARIFVCPSAESSTVRAAARRLVAGYLTVPAYAEFHRWLGNGEALAATWQSWERGERRAAAEAVPDSLVDALFVHGTPRECAEHVLRYVAAGVTVPVLKFLPLDPACDLVAGAEAVATEAGRLRSG
jgi:probable F420-dependent oxidoreductase